MKKTILFATVLLLFASCSDKTEKKNVVCWGDSLTAPHDGNSLKSKISYFLHGGEFCYPYKLQKMLSKDYNVINAGVGGENTLTIMARQGAYPMKLAHDVIILPKDKRKYKMFIGNNDIPAFISSYNNSVVQPLLQRGYKKEKSSAFINECYINNIPYTLSSESCYWRINGEYQFEYNYYINRLNDNNNTDTLKAGSVITTYAMNNLKNTYCNIFFIGQNGGFSDVADLLKQLQAMVAYSKCDKYIIISFHAVNKVLPTVDRLKDMEDSLSSVFGKHYLNLRLYMVNNGLNDAGITPTQTDKDSVNHGQVPPSLLADKVHFNKKGYELIAKQVYNKFKELKY
ncbi:MAG: SGNH/GDSL hydrolase family protein [Bacteroidales bacterium]|nr:SGNH/GDSL hydrolase family protein [Bacteroidales bacterium]